MSISLIESISGIRGIIGEGLTPQRVVDYVSAFAHWVGGDRVVVGRDSRPHGLLIRQLVIATLRARGIEVCDIGIAPSPTCQLMTERLNADGGVVITASHNPVQWNGLKFIAADGLFLNTRQFKEFTQILESKQYSFVPWNRIGDIREVHGSIDEHVESILDLSLIDSAAIAERAFSVVVDGVNGAGSVALPALLEELGCTVHPINCVPNGQFPHDPEPLPENLAQLKQAVLDEQADLGIVIDPDGDRCALVDGDGEYLVEEYTLAIAVDYVLNTLKKSQPGALEKPVVTNLSTTMAIDKIAEKYGTPVIRTKVGEINVSGKMAATEAVIGGEGNGGVILAESHLGRDSLVATALVLQQLVTTRKSLREYYNTLPRFVMSKQKMEIGDADPDEILQSIQLDADGAQIDMQDGVKYTWSDHWVHLRKSNTEPIIRVYAEARTEDEAKSLATSCIRKLRQLI